MSDVNDNLPTRPPAMLATLRDLLLTLLILVGIFSPMIGVGAVLLAMQPKSPSALLAEQLAAASAATGGATIDPAAFERGKAVFLGSCTACHGEHGEAKPGLGKAIAGSTFVQGLSDKELVAFIKKGRDPSDPLNTTGVGMPSKGGNPAINDKQLEDLVAFIRGIQSQR